MRRKTREMKKRILASFLTIAIIISLFSGTELNVKASETSKTNETSQVSNDYEQQIILTESEIEIESFEQLMSYVQMSKTDSLIGYTLRLTKDIELTEQNKQDLINGVYDLSSGEKVRSLTFSSQNKKFGGVFDGQGYTISGLEYDASELGYAADTGLFSYTDGAIIKDLILKDAHVDADYRGGFIVGSARNTTFEKITVKDSYMRVSCSNNVLTLVTDGGLVGGGIAGEAVNCVVYNCESNNTRINNNNTAGVAALGGKGLYLGGLVGTADDHTLIEYSRVIGGEVKSHYDVAVGALGGNTLYVGGIVGQLQKGSKVMDCFATPYLYFYTATYVAVGAGNSGRIGGIAAATYGSSCEITRCHFAGTAESYQYNAVLVIPIIQNNTNISGLVDKWSPGTATNSYFRESTVGDVDVLGNDDTTEEYGPQDDTTYVNRTFWEGKGYDFVGDITRNTTYSAEHANKWVMDYEQGIPVHGYSVSASFDFPGSGEVSIGATTLMDTPVTSSDAYAFAVQGVHPREVDPTVDLGISLKEGYNFYGWYKVSDYLNHYATNVAELEAVSHVVENKVADDTNVVVDIEDNDLFVACVKADVSFHEVDGSEISGTARDYTYGETLDNVVPNTTIEGAKFYGWTTVKNENEAGGGYSAITTTQLNNLFQKGEVYFAGDPVKKTMELYPIYTSYVTNVKTVFEGNEQDSYDDETRRHDVGYTIVDSDDNGVYIDVILINLEGNAPDGYRFIGWYETIDGVDARISDETKYYISDLTKETTYTARFEYRVDYYSTTKDIVVEEIDNTPYASVWHTYKESLEYLKDVPIDAQDTFTHWGSTANDDCDNTSCATQYSEGYQVIQPMNVYAHITGKSNYDILVTSDFPGASVLTTLNAPSTSKFTISCAPNEGYNFLFWGANGQEGIYYKWTNTSADWKAGIHSTSRNYYYEAHLNADVIFHAKDDTETLVQRIYEEPIFLTDEVTHTYVYPLTGKDIEGDEFVSVSAVSPTKSSMEKEGYAFLGWIADTEVEVDGVIWNYIYDVEGDAYCTTDPDKAVAYLVSEDDVVTETMDLYPVYAKYDVKTTTNVENKTLPTGVNKPSLPTFTPEVMTTIDSETGMKTITVTAEHDSTVVIDGQEQTYQLVGFTCEVDGVTTDIFEKGTFSGNTYTVSVDVQAGQTHLFTAIYEPLVIVYHIDGSETEMIIRNTGDLLGPQPTPNYENISGIDNTYMMGWTDNEPSGNKQWIFDTKTAYDNAQLEVLDSSTVVAEPMDLYPVFVKTGLVINSSIDTVVTSDGVDVNTVRYLDKVDANSYALVAEEYPGYEFKGWYLADSTTPYTTDSVYPLQDFEFFYEGIITAVYEKLPETFKVNYHDLNGNIIYSVDVVTDTRGFVETVDGMEIPIDEEAFVNLDATLIETQIFEEWNWWTGTEYKAWADFKDDLIAQNMDLYPTAYQVTFYDSSNEEYINKMDCFLVTDGEERGINAVFKEEYNEPSLTVEVKALSYDMSTAGRNSVGKAEMPTNVYVATVDANENTVYQSASEGTVNTDENGIAIHYFYGSITIEKKYEDTSIDEIVMVTIRKVDDASNTISIPIEVKQGTGQVVLKVESGMYEIVENDDWSWRDQQVSVDGVDENNQISVNVTEDKTVTITNERTDYRWFSSSSRIENGFNINE